jgi:hypothetical protein
MLAVAAAAAALTVAAAAPAKSGNSAAGWRTIYVIEHATTDAVTDLAPAGDSAGDVLTFANEVFDKTNANHSGHDNGFCVRTVKGAAWECMWTTFLAGGHITVEGPYYDTRNSRLAITGGTGVYASARGWMDLLSRAGGTQYDFVFHLAPS